MLCHAGLTSLAMAANGIDVTATDLPILTDGLLGSNIRKNAYKLSCLPSVGDLAGMPLDWTAQPDSWLWPDGKHRPPFDLIVTADSSQSRSCVPFG